VSAHDATVTLRGAVGSHRQKREASRVAHCVHGITNVINDLDVQILSPLWRQDDHVLRDVLPP
jgi:hypothetical protein